MTRKVTVDLTDAVGSFMTKTNQISDYIGDLDNLDSTFSGADNTVVSALNRVGDLTDSINRRLFGESAGPLHMQGINCDSASFALMRAGQLIADSATIDSAFIKNLDVDFLMVDSARIERLTVSEAIIDSALIDSATIQRLRAPNLLSDSAHINTLTTHTLSADSAYFDMATIENTFVTTLYMDDAGNVQRALDNLKLFTVKNEAGNVVLGGYFLSTSNTVSVP
jgi:hypothetical protein